MSVVILGLYLIQIKDDNGHLETAEMTQKPTQAMMYHYNIERQTR